MEEKIIKEYYPFLKLIEHKGKEILFLDVSNITADVATDRFEKTKEVVKTFPEESILFLTDYNKISYEKESLQAAREFAKANKPFVNKSAIIGIEGLEKIAYQSILIFSGRTNIKIFYNKEAAYEWLIS